MSKHFGKPPQPLRFASFVRVSTEDQEQEGESLKIQKADNEHDVETLGGKVVALYGGQEHATAGWEKKELDRLLADAARGKFDALIVNKADRWSRDNRKSEEGMEVFKQHRVRFFVRTREYDLFDEDDEFSLSIDVVIARRSARSQSRRSLKTRIKRAQEGKPACGKLPFGRTWDGTNWGVDPKKQAIVVDVARRYLAGEALPKLAAEYGLNHSNLTKVLRDRCGAIWDQEFDAPRLNIHETVKTSVPPLLPEATIKALRHRLTANRTYYHKPPVSVHDYLLSGHIICAVCGYTMFGQMNPRGRYYRHAHSKRDRECPLRPRPLIPADKIESDVVYQLFKTLGNPAAIKRAVEAAIPDCDKTRKRHGWLEGELEKIDKARGRLVSLIVKGVLTERQAEAELKRLTERETGLRDELEQIAARLADMPDEAAIETYVEQIESTILVYNSAGEKQLGGNDISTYLSMLSRDDGKDKRALIEAAFSLPLADGRRAGVYVSQDGPSAPFRPKKWSFTIKGRLEFEEVMSRVSC